MIKLNLGCHNSIRKGYVNIDRDQYDGVDKVADVFNLDMPDGCADEIYASNIIEHAPHVKTLEILKNWNRLLCKDGILYISVPDFDRTIEIYLKTGLTNWVINFLYGDQGYEGAFHYTAFNEQRLTELLRKAGFTDISRVDRLPGNQPSECSNLVSTLDYKLVCLNLVAIKGN